MTWRLHAGPERGERTICDTPGDAKHDGESSGGNQRYNLRARPRCTGPGCLRGERQGRRILVPVAYPTPFAEHYREDENDIG